VLERLRRRRHHRNGAVVSGDVDFLVAIFVRQLEVQRAAGTDPTVMVAKAEVIQYIKDMVLAAEDELHEVLGETGWKPWATSRHIHTTAAQEEWIDVLCFVVNIALALGLSPQRVNQLHREKTTTNLARQRDGYTGVKA
jgi:predicted Zn-dependent protease